MSIQTQIDRISNNISSALTAIADKGVTVPDGSTSDALAELIAAIDTGGAYKVFVGSFTVTDYLTYSYVVNHDLGMAPIVGVWVRETSGYGTKGYECIGAVYNNVQGSVGFNETNKTYTNTVIGYVANFAATATSAYPFCKATDTQIVFRSGNNMFYPGTYDYILIGW